MKKLEIHVFPSKTTSGKNYKISLAGAIVSVVCVVAGVAGFLMFSPVSIVDNVTSGNITDIHRQNVAIKNELSTIRESVDETILKVEETRLLRDSTLKFGGLGFTLESALSDDEKTLEGRKGLKEIEHSFRQLIDTLEKDSALAAKLPILHPMKNGHAIKKRFEMVHDPFTDQELPHRGIDYVAVEGDTVYATGGGVVTEVRKHRGFGLSMKVEHMKGVRTFYAHLGKNLVDVNAKVKRGQPIAIVGESGTESSVGLHYEIRLDGNSVNPESFFITK
ncbi:MAG: M23 family metallopeptidase [Fibrobacter sp.]|nr:M23 family metallopeptidase [Fibrobacter sp.]